MIFFVANDGSVIKTLPSPVYQGSTNANTIYLVAPFAPNLSVTVAFQLPNGVRISPALMTAQGTIAAPNGEIVNEKTGKNYAVWTYALPNDITRYFGTVTAQFLFYGIQGNVITASSAASFTVGRGVPIVLPDEPSEDVYEQILSALSSLQGQLDSGAYAARSIYAWNSAYEYGANEIAFVPDVGEYGAFVKSELDGNTIPPFDALGELNTGWELVVDFNDIYQYLRYGVAVKDAMLTFSPLDQNVSVEGKILKIERSL